MTDDQSALIQNFADAVVERVAGPQTFPPWSGRPSRWDRVIRGVNYVLTRGSLIGVGAGVAFLAHAYGTWNGNEEGFQAGCRAAVGSAAAMCLHAQAVGAKIQHIKTQAMQGPPGMPLTIGQTDEIAKLCAELRASVPDELADHYGCQDQ